jgi:hypothetical protein
VTWLHAEQPKKSWFESMRAGGGGGAFGAKDLPSIGTIYDMRLAMVPLQCVERSAFSAGKAVGRGVKLTTHLYPVPSLRTGEVTPPLPHMLS